jgi:magnesium-transporting ATPase (P-type)
LPNSTLIFAKRSISLTKTYSIMAIFFVSLGVFVLDAITILGNVNATSERYVLLPVGFLAFGILFFATPVILLYVYDKNNGVLEYFLSLGWNQSDIFKRYLKASLLLALTIFVAAFAANVTVSVIAGTPAEVLLGLEVLAITAALGFATVSLVTVSMIAFSSLQKQRVGSNTPLALTIGVLAVLPTWLIPYFLPFPTVVLIDLLIAGFVGALSTVLLIASSRLIRREKMLP